MVALQQPAEQHPDGRQAVKLPALYQRLAVCLAVAVQMSLIGFQHCQTYLCRLRESPLFTPRHERAQPFAVPFHRARAVIRGRQVRKVSGGVLAQRL